MTGLDEELELSTCSEDEEISVILLEDEFSMSKPDEELELSLCPEDE